MKKTHTAHLSLIIGTLLILLDQLFWTSHAKHINISKVGTLMSTIQVQHIITLIGLDLVIISLGYIYSKKENSLAEALKLWLYTVVVGFISAIVCFLLTKKIDTNAIYSIFLPIIRNVSPVITGVILSLICYPFMKKVNYSYLKWILLALLLLPTLSGIDSLGLSDGYSISFTFILFYLGVIEASEEKRFSIISLILLCLINVLCVTMMPLCSKIVHGDMSTALRFTTSTSFFEVMIAIYFIRLLRNVPFFNKWSFIRYIPIASLVLIGAGRLENIVSWNEDLVGTSFNKLFRQSELEALLIVFVIFLVTLLIKQLPQVKRIVKSIEEHFSDFELSNQWFTKETQLIKQYLKNHRINIIMLLCAYILSFASFIAMNTSYNIEVNPIETYNIFCYTLFARQFFVLLNTLMLVLEARFLMAITRHYWVSVLITGFAQIVITVANRLKVIYREEPIIPGDLAMIKAWKSLLGMMGKNIIIASIVLVVLVIVLIIYLEKKHPHAIHMTLKKSIIWVLVTSIFFSGTLLFNHDGSYVNALMRDLGDQPYFYNQLFGAKLNGPLLQFLNNIDVSVMDEPENYSKEIMTQIYKKYAQESARINRRRRNDWDDQIVIMGLSESFADPYRIPELTLANDPIPYIRSLMKTTTSGLMYSTGYGGGTANMEYMALTGLNQGFFSAALTPYTQLVTTQNQAYAFSRLFNQAVAIHPYIGVYYSRQTVYQNFGFNKFMYLGSKYPIKHQSSIDRSDYLSDETAYANTVDEILDAQGSKFINLVTMQNHLPYDNNYYNGKEKYAASGNAVTNDYVRGMVEEYVMGLHYTDEAVKNFIEKIDSINKPITFVFYGDHLPGIYWDTNNNNILHQTDYFIYSNKYARRHLGRRIYKQYDLVAPTDFMSLVQKQTLTKTTPYSALLEKVLDELPVITTKAAAGSKEESDAAMINDNGELIKYGDLSSSQKELYNDYKLVQYDMTAGNNYLENMNFTR